MMPEAQIVPTEAGLVPKGEGWYVLNLADVAWRKNAKFGAWSSLEGDVKFAEYGIHVHVLWPGQPNCHYHEENCQESFLVLSGECLLIVEGTERLLKAWDFVHCPPGTAHVFVGAGSGPCALLMAGTRKGDAERILYEALPLALRHGAAATETTDDPKISYRDVPASEPLRSPWPLGGEEPSELQSRR